MSDYYTVDISCIIINYNSAHFTLNCIDSILSQKNDDISFEIVVIDNNSEIDNYLELKSNIELLKKSHQNIKYFRSKINTGFSGGNMFGVQMATKCKYYAFINNDTILTQPNCLSILMNFMENNKKVGVCGPQMLNNERKPIISIGHFASPLTQVIKASFFEKIAPNKFVKRRKVYNKPIKVNYIQGAFMFVRADDFETLGGFDTNIFLYYEESDLCLRFLKQLGKTTFLVPNAEYIHFVGKSTSKEKRKSLIKAEQKISLLYYTKKHFSTLEYKFLLCFLSIKYLLSSIFKPRNWKIFTLLLNGAPLTMSLKQKQSIKNLN